MAAFKRCRPGTHEVSPEGALPPTPVPIGDRASVTPFGSSFRNNMQPQSAGSVYTPPCTAQRRSLETDTQNLDPNHCQQMNRRWEEDPRDKVQYTRRHMEMLQQQKDQEIAELVQRKDAEIAAGVGRNQTLMKGVLQLHQQAEGLKQSNAQKDEILQRAAQRIQELEMANLELRRTLHQVTGGMANCGGGFNQAPPPPPAVF